MLIIQPHLAQRFKKEQSSTCSHSSAFMTCFREITLSYNYTVLWHRSCIWATDSVVHYHTTDIHAVLQFCSLFADSLDNGDKIDAIIVDCSKAFDLVPHGRLLTEIANSGVDSRVVVWIREFLLGRTQRVRVGGQLSAEVRVTSGVPQGSVLGTLLFLAYVNDIWRNMESTIRLFADDCNLQKNYK